MVERSYRAPCPACGAPVEFRSAQSTHAVCGFCRSSIVRQDDVLSRVGKTAELFDDYSPLQLMATGRYQKRGFTLIGRRQYESQAGVWTEWNVLFDDGNIAWLSEDNGAYVFSLPYSEGNVPRADQLQVGYSINLNGRAFSVAFKGDVLLKAAEGEFNRLPSFEKKFTLAELRSVFESRSSLFNQSNAQNQNQNQAQVLSIDYSDYPAQMSLGSSVLLADLSLKGLKDEANKEEKARQFACPQCGSTVEIKLDSTKSLTCNACKSLIDVSKGIGSNLQAAQQRNLINPLIALGSIGKLEGADWQVVGFQHRIGRELGADDELFGWSEYLLFNRQKGFIFLVDATDGWSIVRPTTGSPQLSNGGQKASYLGGSYALESTYAAKTDFVSGEFYWHLSVGEQTKNKDFVNAKSLLSFEKSATEEVWSSGYRVESKVVVQAFNMLDRQQYFQRDASPLSDDELQKYKTIAIIVLVILLLIWLSSRSSCDPNVEKCESSSSGSSWRSSGGSWGGYSSGGGHK